jgi:hypothetical protein
MTISDLDVLDAIDSFGDESVKSGSLLTKLRDEGFDVTDIVNTLYYLIDRGILFVNITGTVQRARLDK